MSNIYKRLINILNYEYFLLFLILLLAFALRLYKIDNPVADWHSFRQADTASVTRQYINQGSINLLYPRYHDISTTQSGLFNPEGYRYVEFPIFSIFHFFIFSLLPYIGFDTSGRMVSVIASVISAYLIFLIVKKLINYRVALVSSVLFAILPFNIYFSRVILPEPLAVTLGLSAIWFFILYLEDNSISELLFSALFFSAALLIKPYLFFYGIPIIYLFFSKHSLRKGLTFKSIYFWGLIILIPFVIWRSWISQYPEGIPFWKWTFNGDGIRFKPAFWKWIFGERLTALVLGYWGLIPFVFGILAARGRKLFPYIFLFGLFIYVSVFATANVRHDYYQTIGIPAIVIVVAIGISELWNTNLYPRILSRTLLAASIFIMVVASFVQVKEFYKINRPEIIEAGVRADMLLPKNALVIAPYNGDTAFLYHTKRSGWPVVDRPIDEMIGNKAQYFISVDLNHYQTQEFAKRFKVLESTPSYIIIDLTTQNP